MKLALVQMRVEPGAVEENLARAADHIADCARRGADMVLLPEALPFGWTVAPGPAAGPIPGGPHFQRFAQLAQLHRVYLCAGIVEQTRTAVFNSAILLSPRGELLLHHRKLHELAIAHDSYALGDRLGVVETPLGRLGLMICADGFAPGQVVTRTLALMGAQLILSPSAWAVPPGHDNAADPYGKLWLDNYGTVARAGGLWIAGCSNVGPITQGAWAGHQCIGCSLVVGPDGQPAARGRYAESEVILAEIPLRPRPRAAAD